MKKLAIGCGIVVLVVGIAAAGVSYYLYRQVASTFTQFAELAEIPNIERSVRNRAPFTPPANEELTDAQIEKLVQVQTGVRRRIGERMTEFEAKYKALSEKHEADITDAPALLRAYADLAKTWLDAKRSQVEALNTAGLSLEEYKWIRHQAYRALGMAFVDLDFAKIVEDAKNGVTSDPAGQLLGAIGPDGPEANRARIEKFKKQLEENLALASFGL
jgi:hypothetical protein